MVAENSVSQSGIKKASGHALALGISFITLALLRLATDTMLKRSVTNEELDIYYLCVNIFGVNIDKILFTGALASLFMPIFHRFKKNSPAETPVMVSNIFNVVFVYALIIVSLAWVFAPNLVELFVPDFSTGKKALAVEYLRVFLPYNVAFCIWTFGVALLQSTKRFKLFSLIKLITPMTVFIFMCFACKDFIGLKTVVGSIAGGMILQVVILFFFLSKTDYKLRPVFQPFHQAIKDILKMGGFLLIGTVITLFVLWIKARLVSSGDSGDLGNLSLMERFKDFYSMFFIGMIPMILLPSMSEEITDENREKTLALSGQGLRLMLFATAPVTIFLVVFAGPIAELLYGGANSADANISGISTLLMIFMAGMIGQCGLLLFGKMPQLFKDTKSVATVSVITQLLMIPMNIGFYKLFSFFGLALTDAVIPLVTTTLYLLFLRKHIPGIFSIFRNVFFLKWLICILVVGTLGWVVKYYAFPDLGKTATVFVLLGNLIGWLLCYAGLSSLLRIPELKLVMKSIRRR